MSKRLFARSWPVFATTVLALAVFATVFASASSADLSGSTFESTDGNLVVDAAGHTDWANVGGLVPNIDLPSGSSDNSFGQGTKEDDPAVTVVTGSIPPNKNDLTRSYLASETVGGQTFLYLAWERAVNTGSANLDFELDQGTQSWDASSTGAVTITRTEGDLLFTYDFSGSGTPTLGLNFWLTDGHGHSGNDCTAPSQHTLPCWGNHIPLTPSGTPAADGAVNQDDVTDNVASPLVGTLTAGLFGEAALNLTAIPGIFSANTCKAFGTQFVKSRSSGSSIDAELKDFIAPEPIHVSNCGSIELKKVWAGTPDSATLKIGTSAGGSQTASQLVSGANGTTGAQEVENGNYFVSETVAGSSNYTSSLSCADNGGAPFDPGAGAIPVSSNHQVVCTFTNTRKTGTIQLNKHWVGTAGNASLALGSTGPGSANVATGSANGADGNTGEATVETGTYFVSEQFDANLYTKALACFNDANHNGVNDQGDSPVAVGASESVAVGSGQHVVCTYTNTRKPGSIELTKVWNGTKANVTLAIGTTAGAGDIASQALVGANGTTGAKSVASGTYFVSETFDSPTKANDYISTLACTRNGQPASVGAGNSIDVGSNDTVVCTFTNVRKGTIEIVKQALGDSATFDYTLRQQGGEGSTPFQLSPAAGGSDSADFSVEPGDYTVAEAAKDGWALTGLSCMTGGSKDPSNPAQADIRVAAGEFEQCTYTNTKLATLIVKKVVDNSNGGGSKAPDDFAITVAGVGSGPGSSTGTTYSGLMPGTYNVTEAAVAGYSLTKVEGCAANGSITLHPGEAATCTLTNTSAAPPPPPSAAPPAPPAPKVDIQITKSAAPNPVTVGKQVTWSLVVTNNGPNNATGVTVADPVPAGVTFVSVTSSQGTCTGGALVSCRLGNLSVGASVTITLVTTAATTGTITNTATTVANEQETNTANNSASASVLVNGPFVPPVTYCTAVAVSPKQLLVGRANTLDLRVSQHGKAKAGVKVRVKGSTIRLTTRPSNGKGVIKQQIKPMKAGIVVFTPVAAKSCKNPRIGVIGVFTPPVTG